MARNVGPAPAYHLLCDHDNSLDAEASPAVVKQVLQGRAKEVDDENVVKALLAKVVDIRNTGCLSSQQHWTHRDSADATTYGSRRESCMSGTRREVAEHRSSWVPIDGRE